MSTNHSVIITGDDNFADLDTDFELINKKSVTDKQFKNCTQASHCMIYTKCTVPILEVYNPKALILMQLRFDGYIGFPGGIVDPGETPIDALNRELKEEVGCTVELNSDDKLLTHYNKNKSLLLHFFAKEVTSDLFNEIEERSMKAQDYGNEVLGVLRVPLYTMTDGFRGFPAFLQNKFIGNSRQQLLQSLDMLKIMTTKEIDNALTAEPLYSAKGKDLKL